MDGDKQVDAHDKTGVSQPTIGRWLKDQVRPTDAGNVAAFAQGYGRNVLEAFVAAGLLSEADARSGLPDESRLFLKRLMRVLRKETSEVRRTVPEKAVAKRRKDRGENKDDQ